MLEKEIKVYKYDDCNECSFCEFPDENGVIRIPGCKIILSKTIMTKEGKEKPNPIVARCGVSGNRLTNLHGCNRIFYKGVLLIKNLSNIFK